MKKRGQATYDMIYILISIIIASFIIFIGYQMNFEITAGLNQTLTGGNSTHAFESGESAFKITEYWYLFFIVGLGIASIASAYFIRTHPIFFIAILLVWTILLFIAPTLGNVYETFSTTTGFEEARTQFSIINFIAYRPHFYLLFIGALMVIALYAGSKREVY